MLIISEIHSQQNLNRPKEKLRTTPRPIVDFSFGEYFVEKLLSIYSSECKRIKSTIHQINSFSTIIKSVEIYIMTIQEAKQIRIADYLQSLGYTPVKQQGKSLWYKSPMREETEASFKVDTELNQWYDFGKGKGGNIIALASELYRSDNVSYLLERMIDDYVCYRGYKDLNDYLCSKPLSQSAEPMKQEGQVQSVRRMMQPPKKRGLKM